MATCICVYCSVFSNPSRAECEARGSWAHSMVLWDQPESVRHLLGGKPTIQGAWHPLFRTARPKAPTGIHDVVSMSVQAAVGVRQPWGQEAVGSSMGAWAGLLRLLGISLDLERSRDAGPVRWARHKWNLPRPPLPELSSPTVPFPCSCQPIFQVCTKSMSFRGTDPESEVLHSSTSLGCFPAKSISTVLGLPTSPQGREVREACRAGGALNMGRKSSPHSGPRVEVCPRPWPCICLCCHPGCGCEFRRDLPSGPAGSRPADLVGRWREGPGGQLAVWGQEATSLHLLSLGHCVGYVARWALKRETWTPAPHPCYSLLKPQPTQGRGRRQGQPETYRN